MDIPAPTLFEVLLTSNPFERNRVSDPSQMSSDVASIHCEPFERLQELATETRRETAQGRGALLLGQAGSGKSHLLARLSNWAAKNQQQAIFVYLHNIQVRPDDMYRYLLKCCVTRLTEDRRNQLQDTLLYRIVKEAIRQAVQNEHITAFNEQNQEAVFEQLAHCLGDDPDVARIIFKFFVGVARSKRPGNSALQEEGGKQAELAVSWLKGCPLDAEDAKVLGIHARPGHEAVELQEQQIGEVFRCIAHLAQRSGKPLILCVDQADNMSADRISQLSMVLHGLIDSTPNLLVVIAGVRDILMQRIADSSISSAAADRFQYRRPIDVRLIRKDDARALVHERLHDFVHRLNGLPEQFQPFFLNDELFPLGSEWFTTFCGEGVEFRPRDILASASDRWREIQQAIRMQGGEEWLNSWNKSLAASDRTPPTAHELCAAIDDVVENKLQEVKSARRLQPGNLPADAGNLLGLVRQLLEQCLNIPEYNYSITGIAASRRGKHDFLDVLESAADHLVLNKVAFVVNGSKNDTALHLRKLIDSSAEHRILVTEADRQPLSCGPKGQEYYDALKKLGPTAFTHLKLKFEQYAELDALMAVVGEARSKDLEVEPKPGQIIPVTEEQVIESYHRHDRYRKHPLLSIFLTEEAPVVPPRPPFPPEHEFRAFVLAKLSFLSGANMIELTKMFAAVHVDTAPLFDEWVPNAKEIVLKMHSEELVVAQPWNNDLYLTIGSKA